MWSCGSSSGPRGANCLQELPQFYLSKDTHEWAEAEEGRGYTMNEDCQPGTFIPSVQSAHIIPRDLFLFAD